MKPCCVERLFERIRPYLYDPQEVVYLHDLFHQVPGPVQRIWESRLTDAKLHNRVSAWFEILLFGFLQEKGRVEFFLDEKTLQSLPDFLFRPTGTDAPALAIEAYVPHDSPELARESQFRNEVAERVRQHLRETWESLPIVATVRLNGPVPKAMSPIPSRVYQKLWQQIDDFVDKQLNSEKVSRPITKIFETENLSVTIDFWPSSSKGRKPRVIARHPARWVGPSGLRKRIEKKIDQHKRLFTGESNPPDGLVVAVLFGFSRDYLSDEDMAEALYGQEVIRPFQDHGIHASERDPSGLFSEGKPYLCGVLLFRHTSRPPYLDGVFFPNPHAKLHIPARAYWELPPRGTYTSLWD